MGRLTGFIMVGLCVPFFVLGFVARWAYFLLVAGMMAADDHSDHVV